MVCCVVAVPACNEVELIGACLRALDKQRGAQLQHIVLLANNCTDGTAAAARAVRLRPGTSLHVVEQHLAPAQANAGMARRLALQAAAELAGNGVLLTTDADGQVQPDWLAETLGALQAGADAVAGVASLDPVDHARIPACLHAHDALESCYDALCDEIQALLDPDPSDPWPRHTQSSGASLAVRADAFARCGGIPMIACGEDRALMAALRRVDARIRHAPEVQVVVSGRTVGRAAGGMADTIRRRMDRADPFLDDRLEPALCCARRAAARRAAREAWDMGLTGRLLQQLTGLSQTILPELLRTTTFGQAWDAVELLAERLTRQKVPTTDVHRQTRVARAILSELQKKHRAPAKKARQGQYCDANPFTSFPDPMR